MKLWRKIQTNLGTTRFIYVSDERLYSLKVFNAPIILIGTGLFGMRQRDLIQWYVSQQNEKNNYSSMEEAAAEVTNLKAIIEVKTQSWGSSYYISFC